MAVTNDPDLLELRKQRAGQLLDQAAEKDINARIIRHRVDDTTDPFEDEAAAVDAITDAAEALAKAESVAATAGLSGKPLTDLKKERRKATREALRENLKRFKRDRKVHQDFIDNPDAYGGLDLGGSPIDADVQRNHVLSLDAAIAEIEAELAKPEA
jgi:hypothetical protein